MRPVAFIAAGGTGGHIYPALAVAEAFKKTHPELEIRFVGTAQGLENKIIPRANFPLHHLSIGPLHSSAGVLRRLKTLLLSPLAVIQCFGLILQFRPLFVLGVGGYASGPMVLLAALLRRPSFIWEPNAVPGLTNRWLSPFVKKSFVVFAEAAKQLRSSTQSGMPVRKEIEDLIQQPRREPNIPFRLFVFGGSQGARALNQVILDWLVEDPSQLQRFEIVHQTGSRDHARIEALYKEAGLLHHPNLAVVEFVHDMQAKYLWADLAICRSGAGTLAELAASGCPALFVPFPFSADDHQTKNAESFEKSGASWVLHQKELSVEKLNQKLNEIFQSPQGLKEKSKHLRLQFRPHAAESLVEQIWENIN